VVLEVQASERLFGGAARLRQKVSAAALDLGARASAQAGTAHAALALARVGASGHGEVASLSELLAPLPLHSLSAVGRHAETLHRLGCRNLAQVRALPRGGLSRRFGAELLRALDAAHGTHPEAFDWLVLPPVFERRMELPWRLDSAEALHQAFERLLHELVAWLAGHQAGTQALQLAWCHDWARHSASRWCEHRVPLAEPTAEVSRLSRMVGEHLRRIELSSPVTDIRLRVDAIVPRESESRSLFNELPARAEGFASDAMTAAGLRAQRSALLSLLERLSIRLGPDRVMAGQLQADHRLAHSQAWHAAIPGLAQGCAPGSASQGQVDGRFLSHVPQPTWVLPVPLPLALSGACAMSGWREVPLYQGPVRLLAGPHRIEAGWWDDRLGAGHEARDHHLASSPHAGLLWVFRDRHAPQDGSSPWRLHGFFA
jgi:protein ImuB